VVGGDTVLLIACRIVVPGVTRPTATLPGDGPATLVADVVGVLARDEELAAGLGQRQQGARVLEHLGLAHRPPGQVATSRTADRPGEARSVKGRSNRLSSNFSVRMRRLASSTRASGTPLARTSVRGRLTNER